MLAWLGHGQLGRSLLGIEAIDYIFEKASVAQAFPASNFTTGSAGYTNLLNGSGGPTISVTITKAAGTSIWIAAGFTFSHSSGTAFGALGVNDGTSDYDVASSYNGSSTSRLAFGDVLITGLGAGTFTFTLRVKTSAATLTFGTANAATLRAQEVSTSNVQVINRINAGAYNIAATTNTDLLDQAAGNSYSVSLTKLSGTDLIALGVASAANTVGSRGHILVANDGTNDYDFARSNSTATGGRQDLNGIKLITGVGSGSWTPKLRVRSTGGTGNQWQESTANRNRSSYAVFEAGRGGMNASANSVQAAGSFTWTSTSYVDLLDNAGGTAVTLAFTKLRGDTKVVLRGALSAFPNTTAIVGLGVNDGSSDHDLSEMSFFSGRHFTIAGEKAITGLAAGNYTFTLRVKTSANTLTFGTTNMAGLMAMEAL